MTAVVPCVLLLVSCASDADADLEARVEELERENAELRQELADRASDDGPEDTGTGGAIDSGAATSTSGATTTTTTTVAPRAVRGSRQRPIALGRRIPVGDWVYRVQAFEPNVNEVVAALDEGNEPPAEGQVYARLRMRARYVGEGAGDPRRLRINLVSPEGKSIGAVSVCCRPGRDTLDDQAETFTGGIVEGWIYYLIAAEDALGGKFLGFDPNGDFPGVPGGIGFFRVN